MSQIVEHGGVVYLSGQVCDLDKLTSETHCRAQVEQTLAKVDALLKQAGTDKITPTAPPLVQLTILGHVRSYLGDVSDGVLLLAVAFAFVLGVLFSASLILFFWSESRSRSQGQTEGHQGGQGHEEDFGELLVKYDFESHDLADEDKIRRWQWCTYEQIQQLGLYTQAPTRMFEGFRRVDVPAIEKDVEAFLLSSNVDFTKFDKRKDLECVTWHLLRAEAYFMVVGAGSQSLLMIETVRLRWTFGDRVLIQKRDGTLLGANGGLPGMEKVASESPACAAKRMWKTVFKLPAETASFVEDTMEDQEITGYKGLRCVERSYIIEVKMLSKDRNILSKVGLPSHAEFTTATPSEFSEGGDIVRRFQWITEDQARKEGVPLGDEYDSVNSLCAQSLANSPASRTDKLRSFLMEAGVNMEPWERPSGEKGNKLNQLAKELSSGECVLTKTSQGVQRCVTVVAMRLWSPDRKLLLVDKGRTTLTGEEKWHAQLPGEKKDHNESLQDAPRHICERQLGFTEDDAHFPDESAWEYYDYTDSSSRYHGLSTKYHKFFVDAVLEDDEDLLKRVGLTGRVESLRPEGFEASQQLTMFASQSPMGMAVAMARDLGGGSSRSC